MDHLGISEFMVLGFCIGGPFIWNLLKRIGDRVVAAMPAEPSGYRVEMPGLSYNSNINGRCRAVAPNTSLASQAGTERDAMTGRHPWRIHPAAATPHERAAAEVSDRRS